MIVRPRTPPGVGLVGMGYRTLRCLSSTVQCFAAARLCNSVRSRFTERTVEQCSPSCGTTASAQQYGARASAQVVCGIPSLTGTKISLCCGRLVKAASRRGWVGG